MLKDSVVSGAVRRCAAEHGAHNVVVGFSGGVDSTALLVAATACRPAISVSAIHINHGLNPAADAWQAHCAAVCRKLDVQLIERTVTVAQTGNVEANARQARYAVFAELVGADELLLLGHHADDQLETVLQRLFRGRGLLPMRTHGTLADGGQFARPLLGLGRDELAAYVRDHGVTWIEDPGNADVSLERNYLRHRIVPDLRGRWRQVGDAVIRVAHHGRDLQLALRASLKAQGPRVPLEDLPQDAAARRAWLRAFLEAHGNFRVTDRALDAFLTDLAADKAAHLAMSGCSLRVWQGQLYLVQPLPAADALPAGQLLTSTSAVVLPHGTLRFEPCAADAVDAVEDDQLRVCFRRGGEQLDGRELSTLFAQAGVAPWWRDAYPLLCRNGTLVAVPGVAVLSAEGIQDGRAWRAVWIPADPAAVAQRRK